MPSTTPSCAEQGIASAIRNVAISRSRRVARMRVVSVAIVTQPRPSTIGSTARPFMPIAAKPRLASTDSRAK